MLGVYPRRLSYWARLRLVRPRARWGERFYTFTDLVALETIKRLTANRVPARRLRRAILALEAQLGEAGAPLSRLQVVSNGREVVVVPPGAQETPIEPLSGQYVLRFETSALALQLRRLKRRTAEEWFELGLAYDARRDGLPRAVEAFRRATALAPQWLEPHVNLGTALYLLGRLEEARSVLERAVALAPASADAHYDLGCVLEPLGEVDAATSHFERAVALSPRFAEAHLNLALICQKRGEQLRAKRHLSAYLRCEPRGAWAEFARTEIRSLRAGQASRLSLIRSKD